MSSLDPKCCDNPPVTALVADTNWWANSVRLAIGLADAGCHVDAICPQPNHALTRTRAVRRTFPYKAFTPVESLSAAIREVKPDIIIPACDRSVGHLHELYARAQAQGAAGADLVALIERSLGLPSSYGVVSSRYDLLTVAREEGICVPDTHRVTGVDELVSWGAQEPFPWVLKADRTWGGGGVRVVRSIEEAKDSLRQLTGMSRLSRAFKRLLVNRDPFWIRDWWIGSSRGIIAQAFINGRPANCAVVCWEGRILAGIAVEVARTEGATGPASVVRIVDNRDMLSAAERIASRLQLSGFFGLDFMIDRSNGKVFLIEMNPRLAPPCHLRMKMGRDLAGALWAKLADRPIPVAQTAISSDLIAYFPQGMKEEAHIPPGCHRDIPQGEPELVAELLNPFPDRTLMFRLAQRLNRKVSMNGVVDEWMNLEEETHQNGNSELLAASAEAKAIDRPVNKMRAHF